jgi:hypothetical protein
VLLLFGPIENPRWPPAVDIIHNGQLKKFLFLVTAAILNGGQSEQKVTTLDKDLARNISAKYGSNPSSDS